MQKKEVEQDVNSESSPEEQEEVVNTPETDQQETEQQPQVPPQESEEVKEQDVAQDDRPIQNVAWEAKRKADELISVLPDIVKNAVKEQLGNTPQQPKYSKAQLKAYSGHPETPMDQRIWALEELERMDKEERTSEMRQMFESNQRKVESDIKRQQTFQYVIQSFPDIAIKDAGGNFVGFNVQSPLYAKVDEYMRTRPELQQHPEGLALAVKAAAFDLGLGSSGKLQKKIDQTTAQLRREQKKQLTGGSGVTPAASGTKAKYDKLMVQYQQTRDPAVFREMARIRGLLPTAE
jgi:hypothetical protein